MTFLDILHENCGVIIKIYLANKILYFNIVIKSQTIINEIIKIMKKTAILWDWDNTLVDTFDAILSAQNVMRRFYGLPDWTRDDAKYAMNLSWRNLMKNLIGEEKLAEARKIYLDAYIEHSSKINFKQGAIEALKFAECSPLHNFSIIFCSLLRFLPEFIGLDIVPAS